MGSLTELLIVVGLTLLAGVFVAAEIALVSVRRSRVDQLIDERRRGAPRVRRLIEDPARFLAVIQIAITFIGFLSSAVAAVSLTSGLAEVIVSVGLPQGTADAISLIVVTSLVALFSIVIGELVPKALALAYPDRTSLLLAGPVDVLGRLLSPLVRLLTFFTRALVRPFGADVSREAQITAEELKLIVERGGDEGVLEAEEEQMIHAVIELGERRVHEVMVPRIDIVGIEADADLPTAVERIVAEGHSRLPAWERSVDDVVGVLYAKDLLPILMTPADERPTVRSLLRPPVFVAESMTIDDLLHEFRRRKVHLAIVGDEYGGRPASSRSRTSSRRSSARIQDDVRRGGGDRRPPRRRPGPLRRPRLVDELEDAGRPRPRVAPRGPRRVRHDGRLVFHRIGGCHTRATS